MPSSSLTLPPGHCLTAEIPELGLFLVGTPAGRVALFALTSYAADGRTVYAFRLAHLLPFFKDDNGKNVIEDVWAARLLGVAVGPVEENLDVRKDGVAENDVVDDGMERMFTRRWRVLLYFSDHSVRAFEVGKEGEGSLGAVSV